MTKQEMAQEVTMSSRQRIPKAVERCYRRVLTDRVVQYAKFNSLSKVQQKTPSGWFIHAKMIALDAYIDTFINNIGLPEGFTRRIGSEVTQARA